MQQFVLVQLTDDVEPRIDVFDSYGEARERMEESLYKAWIIISPGPVKIEDHS